MAAKAAIREKLKTTARTTLSAIETGSFIHELHTYSIPAVIETRLYTPADLSTWDTLSSRSLLLPSQKTQISIWNVSTLEAANLLRQTLTQSDLSHQQQIDNHITSPRIGILNFASATKPGGGFINGAQAQEESIARASNIYPSLMTDEAQQFYKTHKQDNRKCYYTHTIIWSSGVSIFRDDQGTWHEPYQVDIVTSPAVNAGVVRRRTIDATYEEKRIETVMRERMSRILFVFEKYGVSRLVLGSFGTGVFQNKVELVARLWVELLVKQGARFEKSFEQVVFGVIDEKTFDEFKAVFEQYSADGSESHEDPMSQSPG